MTSSTPVGTPDTAARLAARLRTETRGEHERAERHAFHQHMLRGSLPRPQYAWYLAELHRIHDALATALAGGFADRPDVRELVESAPEQPGLLAEDLGALSWSGAPALDSTARVVRALAEAGAAKDASLVGAHYVLEGSKNGSRYVARSVRQAYALEGSAGTRYFDPYGADQPAHWRRFKERMDAIAWSPAEQERVLDGARGMFDALTEVAQEILDRAEEAREETRL